MDPLVPIAVVCVDDDCCDPALKLSQKQLTDYRKTFAASIINADGVIRAGKVPRWFVVQHINGAFLTLLRARFDEETRIMQAFLASCHEVKSANGVLKPKASQVTDGALDQSVADVDWWNVCVAKFGAKVCRAIGRTALALAELPEDERGVFPCAGGPEATD